MLREARLSDIGLLSAVYGRAVGEWGFGPIADLDAAVTASISGKPMVLPYDHLFGVDSAEFRLDVMIAEDANREFAGFYICKTLVKDGRPVESPPPYGVAAELWYAAVIPQLRSLGIGTRLVCDALALVRSRTRGRGGLLARVTGRDYGISRLLQSQGFIEVGMLYDVTRVWLHPKSDEDDDFADIGFRG
jgi:ribosomal protein S18 acetylase RimI-like enzyme